MFTITFGQGFRMTMENRWTVSVQFGLVNYCDRKLRDSTMLAYPSTRIDWHAPRKDDFWESQTAEIAAWYGERENHMGMSNWYNFGNDNVKGYCTTDAVVQFLGMVSKFPARRLTKADYKTMEPFHYEDAFTIAHRLSAESHSYRS